MSKELLEAMPVPPDLVERTAHHRGALHIELGMYLELLMVLTLGSMISVWGPRGIQLLGGKESYG